MLLSSYTQFGGKHHVTASLTNVLAASGITSPADEQPLSEAMILGIGGGLGAGYILWEFKWAKSAIIVMGFRNRWNYTVDYLTHACERLNIAVDVQETVGKKKASANLYAAIEAGTPPLVWVDKAQMPYLQLPPELEGHASHVVGIAGLNEDTAIIDDYAAQPFDVPLDVLVSARARIPSDKNRVMTVTPNGPIDLSAAIEAGLQDCASHLGRSSDSFALPVLRKWARLMTDAKHKKGWPVVFAERKGLYATLRSVFEGIELDYTGGGGLRSLYADFLSQSAATLDRPALSDAEKAYRIAAAQWTTLAEIALPDSNAVMKETKQLMVDRYAALKAQDEVAVRQVSEHLQAMLVEHNANFPLDDAATATLFEAMQTQLTTLYDAELTALAALNECRS